MPQLTRSREPQRQPAVQGRLGRIRHHLPEVVLGSLMVVQVATVVHLVRGLWFQLDAWEFLTRRGTIPGASHGLFAPWGGHWETIPALLYRAMFAFVGMHHYLPYVLIDDAVHLVIVTLVYLLLTRVGVDRWLAVGAAAAVLFYGAGSEVFLTDAPMPLITALACGLAAAYLLLRGRFAGDHRLAAGGLLVLGVMCSGVGLVSVTLVATLTWLRRDRRTALLVVGPAVALFVVWFVAIGHTGGRARVTVDSALRGPDFVWTGLTGATGAWLGVPHIGGFLLLALVLAPLLVRGIGEDLRALAWAGLLCALAEMVLCSVANSFFGASAATASRYEYLAFVLMTPAGVVAAIGLGTVIRSVVAVRPNAVVAVVAVLVGVLAASSAVRLERQEAGASRAFSGIYRSWILGTAQASAQGEAVLTPHPSDGFNSPLDMSLVPDLVTLRALPTSHDPDWRLQAESQFFVSVSATDPDRFSRTHVVLHGLEGARHLQRPGCHGVRPDGFGPPTIDLTTGPHGTEVGITSNATTFSTQIYRSYQGAATRTWGVAPGPTYVATTAKHAVLRVILNGTGTITLCHQ